MTIYLLRPEASSWSLGSHPTASIILTCIQSICVGLLSYDNNAGCLQLRELRENSGKKKDSGNSGNSRPTQGTFMNKVNNLFIWRNTCIELKNNCL